MLSLFRVVVFPLSARILLLLFAVLCNLRSRQSTLTTLTYRFQLSLTLPSLLASLSLRMEVVVIVRGDMPETAAGTNVVVRVPLPRNAVSVNTEVKKLLQVLHRNVMPLLSFCVLCLPSMWTHGFSSAVELSLALESACRRVQDH